MTKWGLPTSTQARNAWNQNLFFLADRFLWVTCMQEIFKETSRPALLCQTDSAFALVGGRPKQSRERRKTLSLSLSLSLSTLWAQCTAAPPSAGKACTAVLSSLGPPSIHPPIPLLRCFSYSYRTAPANHLWNEAKTFYQHSWQLQFAATTHRAINLNPRL